MTDSEFRFWMARNQGTKTELGGWCHGNYRAEHVAAMEVPGALWGVWRP